ncbi:ring finger protein 5 [Chrysochromulina tobinii]|uniref:RING-type E3 ubiquitin transferase n=1 Tax=Chrysochromulina tobinii TaxID=1460289 RepID=A0A0M0K3W0_9EUKA|nr:ring finger protein 5 [Chrysochromulina tobinii]|eukprot:KOO33551.1 ring finger protein 5 [Chrysochromulina sp. CCMP291]
MAGTSQSSEEKVEAVQFFECNICLETACNPVITQCGHLYCWPCLYKAQQAFLSRMLLLLGSLIIFCLLLF